MLMAISNIARVKGYSQLSKDDIAEVVSKSGRKGRSKVGRRQIKRAEKHKLRQDMKRLSE